MSSDPFRSSGAIGKPKYRAKGKLVEQGTGYKLYRSEGFLSMNSYCRKYGVTYVQVMKRLRKNQLCALRGRRRRWYLEDVAPTVSEGIKPRQKQRIEQGLDAYQRLTT